MPRSRPLTSWAESQDEPARAFDPASLPGKVSQAVWQATDLGQAEQAGLSTGFADLDAQCPVAAAYFKSHEQPQTPEDQIQDNWIRYCQTSSGAIFQWEFSSPAKKGRDFTAEPHGSFTTNDDERTIRAALQGIGVMQHMELAMRPYLQDALCCGC